jgi:hypothetical protein
MFSLFKNRTKEVKETLLVSETANSSWNYHLRLVVSGEEKFGGGAGTALCGSELGWDTKLPLSSYGIKSHIPSSYCKKCLALAREQNLTGVEDIK